MARLCVEERLAETLFDTHLEYRCDDTGRQRELCWRTHPIITSPCTVSPPLSKTFGASKSMSATVAPRRKATPVEKSTQHSRSRVIVISKIYVFRQVTHIISCIPQVLRIIAGEVRGSTYLSLERRRRERHGNLRGGCSTSVSY